MKITLILAASKTDPLRKNDPFMPLALPLLAACAPDHEYTLVDLLYDKDVPYDAPVDLVGISARYTAEMEAYRIADRFREKKIPVILGGPQISVVPMRAIRHADAVVIGEAESLWPRIIEDVANAQLRQFYLASPIPFRAPGYTVYQQPDYPSLDTIPAAHRHLLKKKYVFDTVFATRGCHVDCDFCCVSTLFGKRYRMRPVDAVVDEIKTFKRYYYLLDDTVFGRPATYDYYLTLYNKIKSLKKIPYWTGQANLDALDHKKGRAVIRSAVDAGFLYAAIGLESINPATIKSSGVMSKLGVRDSNDAVTKMKESIAWLQDLGVLISGWFVLGYETDTRDTFFRTLEFCKETNIIPAIFYVKAMPGTRLYDRLRREGKLDERRQVNYLHPSLSEQDVSHTVEVLVKKGFSLPQIISRTAFYASKFKKDRIHKTIFSLMTQLKLRGALDAFTSENYEEEGLSRD